MKGKIAIVAVGYNRADSLRRLLRSLAGADYDYSDIPLVISVDHSGDQDVIRTAAAFLWQHGEKKVICHEKRLGLRKHIFSCGDLTEKYGAVMILEDDLYVSPDFYNYAMCALEKYGDHERIAGIALNTRNVLLESPYPFYPLRTGYDIFFQQFTTSWGQVWNSRMWKEFRVWYDRNQELPYNVDVPRVVLGYPESSWAKYFQSYVVAENKYFVFSYESLSTNFGDAGEHFSQSSASCQSPLFYGKQSYRMPEFESGVKYDIYGEPIGLGKYLGVEEEELTCDLWGRKQPGSYKRYLLTCQEKSFDVIKKFSMNMKPMELNIICQISGSGIYLYDTKKTAASNDKPKNVDVQYLEYGYGIINGRDLIRWSLRRLRDKLIK